MKKAIIVIFAAALYSCGGTAETQEVEAIQSRAEIAADVREAMSARDYNSTKTVTSGSFSMEVPSITADYRHLDPESEITYGDTTTGIHLGVYRLEKKELADFIKDNGMEGTVTPDLYGYNRICMANAMAGNKEDPGTKIVSAVTADTSVVNGLKCISDNFTLNINGTDFENHYLFAEGGEVFYMVYFSLPKINAARYETLRDKVLGSFRENR